VVIKAACKPGRRPLLSLSLLHFLATHAASLPLGSPVKWNRQNVVVLGDAAAGVAAGAHGEDPAGALLHRARRAEPTGGGPAPGRQLPLSGALLQGRALPHGARAGNRSAGVISF